jgi:lipopolysaccharide assembly outer membrane protein LptD (OstA)
MDALAAPDANTPIEVDAQGPIDYDRTSGRVTASDNVVITCGKDILRADRVLVDINSGDAYALGNVVLMRGAERLSAAKLHYNFRTRVSSVDAPTVESEPFRILADKVERSADNTYVLRNAKVTTCIYPHPHSHYHVRAKTITVVPDESMTAKGAVWYFGRMPCFYLPYWHQSLDEESGFRFYPGYRSNWGAYLLSSYRYRLSPSLQAQHRLDYRTERGFAVGEDLKWKAGRGFGDLSLYFIDDDKPMPDDSPADAVPIDPERYRLRLRHTQDFDKRTQMLLQLEYVSDTEVRREFFDREYRRARQPESYLVLAHRREAFTVTALANMRLNDFYGNVNRLPEVSLDVFRLQLANSSIYYESKSSVAGLERVWPENSDDQEYSAFRLDSSHMLYQPRLLDGWLNVIPRAGYRVTYYTEAPETRTTGPATNQVTTTVAGDAVLRHAFEVGSEVSYKAFKMLVLAADGQPPWRHVVEPYANYSLRLEPNVLPYELYQFDSVDTLDELHQIRLGVRNKLQTKRDSLAVDVADVDLFTTLKLNADGDEPVLDLINLDSEFRPAPWLLLEVDGSYSLEYSVLARLNSRFSLVREDLWRIGIEHRYRDSDSNLLAVDATFYPNKKWAFNAFGRYEFEGSRLEEQGGYVQRKLDCLGIRLGASVLPGYTRTDGSEREDEYRFMLEIWLTAFPEMGLGSGGYR